MSLAPFKTPSPDEINEAHAAPIYRCRVCRVSTGLHWFNGTSCPVCDCQECREAVEDEYQQGLGDMLNDE